MNIDPHKFGQVVRNLLSNALKFTKVRLIAPSPDSLTSLPHLSPPPHSLTSLPHLSPSPTPRYVGTSCELICEEDHFSSSHVQAPQPFFPLLLRPQVDGGSVTIRVRSVDSFTLSELVEVEEFKLFGKTSFWDMLNQVQAVPGINWLWMVWRLGRRFFALF